MRQQVFLDPNNIDMRELQPFAAMHRDQRHPVPRGLLLLFALAVEGDFFKEIMQLVETGS